MNSLRTTLFLLLGSIVSFHMVTAATGQTRDYTETIRWVLIEAYGEPLTKTNAHLIFEEGKDRFSGSTDCNNVFGTVTIADPKVEFSGIGMTRRACRVTEGSVGEHEFVDALSSSKTFSIEDDVFTLFNRSGETLLKFSRYEPEMTAFADVRWNLTAVTSAPGKDVPKGAFVRFNSKEGSVGGNSGCNVFGGDYKAGDNTLETGELLSTMMACTSLNGVDNLFLKELGRADKFIVDVDILYLYFGEELLLTFEAE